jgi:hypothetical protein
VTFTLRSRVHPVEGGFEALVVAFPEEVSALAEVRSCDCASRAEALRHLASLARDLSVEIAARGDVIRAD